MHRAAVADAQRPADAVVAARAALVVLGALEVRQDVVVAPAVEAHGRPLVVVGAVPADVDHRVERARAPEDAPARQVVAAVVQARLGLAEQRPVPVAGEVRPERERHVDLGRVVGRPRLDDRDPHVRILAQPMRDDTARRARAHDHVVVHRTRSSCWMTDAPTVPPWPRRARGHRARAGSTPVTSSARYGVEAVIATMRIQWGMAEAAASTARAFIPTPRRSRSSWHIGSSRVRARRRSRRAATVWRWT